MSDRPPAGRRLSAIVDIVKVLLGSGLDDTLRSCAIDVFHLTQARWVAAITLNGWADETLDISMGMLRADRRTSLSDHAFNIPLRPCYNVTSLAILTFAPVLKGF